MASFRGLDPKQWTGLKEERGTVDITPGARMNLAEINGAGAIASLRLSLPQAKDALDSVWLCMSWDGATNDVEAPVRFRSSIRCGIEHGGVNDTDSRYGSLAFWYARDCLGLVQNDAFSFSGAGVQMLTNYFEGDDDDVTVTCAILKTTEPVTRTLAIDPANAGVRLRRVLDQSLSPQRAAVLVDGVAAGIWYDPDRNPWKRLAESDVELPPALVRGKRSIRS